MSSSDSGKNTGSNEDDITKDAGGWAKENGGSDQNGEDENDPIKDVTVNKREKKDDSEKETK